MPRGPATDADFTAFVTARQGSLARFGHLLTGDPHSAEDLLQSALAKAYRHWDRIAAMAAPEAYVRRIMVNEHTSWWRLAWRRKESPRSDIIRLAEPASTTMSEPDDELWRHVQELAPRQRAVIVCRFYLAERLERVLADQAERVHVTEDLATAAMARSRGTQQRRVIRAGLAAAVAIVTALIIALPLGGQLRGPGRLWPGATWSSRPATRSAPSRVTSSERQRKGTSSS